MEKFIYHVYLDRGKSNKNFTKFHENVDNLNGKTPDYAGINNSCIIAHHADIDTIFDKCTEGFPDDRDDVVVTEVTRKSMEDIYGSHRAYTTLIEKYFLPHGTFPKF